MVPLQIRRLRKLNALFQTCKDSKLARDCRLREATDHHSPTKVQARLVSIAMCWGNFYYLRFLSWMFLNLYFTVLKQQWMGLHAHRFIAIMVCGNRRWRIDIDVLYPNEILAGDIYYKRAIAWDDVISSLWHIVQIRSVVLPNTNNTSVVYIVIYRDRV